MSASLNKNLVPTAVVYDFDGFRVSHAQKRIYTVPHDVPRSELRVVESHARCKPMPGRFLSLFSPISRLMPEVKAPEGRIKLTEKFLWTALVLVLHLVMSEIPLYGLATEGGADPFFFSRVIFASSKGTLMELGIQPMITANMILQMLAGSGLIAVNYSIYEERAIFTGVTKFFSIVMTAAIALAYLFFGNFGTISVLASAIIFVQLLAVGILIIILDIYLFWNLI